MKRKISISVEESTLTRIDEKLNSVTAFRNKSHLIEYSILKLLEEE